MRQFRSKIAKLGMDEGSALAICAEQEAAGRPDPYKAFIHQAHGAARRGVEWRLTFAEWWAIWAPYYHLRGSGKNGLCMGRNGDVGAYEVGNVYLTTNLGNRRDYGRSNLNAQRKGERRLTKAAYWGKRYSGGGSQDVAKTLKADELGDEENVLDNDFCLA